MVELRYARQRAGFTLDDVSKITGIHTTVLSQFETGHRRPNRGHMVALSRLFPELANYEGVPSMPEARFLANGKPDYSYLESNELSDEELRAKLQDLLEVKAGIDQRAGEAASVVEVFKADFIYELNLAGGAKLYRQGFKVTKDGGVEFAGTPAQVRRQTQYIENSGTKSIYLLQDAVREKFPGQGLIVVEHDLTTVTFVAPAGGLYRLGYTISGKQITLSDEPPEPVVEMKRTLNQAIRRAKVREGQGVPDPWRE